MTSILVTLFVLRRVGIAVLTLMVDKDVTIPSLKGTMNFWIGFVFTSGLSRKSLSPLCCGGTWAFPDMGFTAGISRSLDSLHGEPHGLLNRSLSGAQIVWREKHTLVTQIWASQTSERSGCSLSFEMAKRACLRTHSENKRSTCPVSADNQV
jgi:hypothetical protein